MRVESLRSLLTVRQAATSGAKTALAQTIAVETAANAAVVEADRRITAEADIALSLGADDGAVEAYARWLPQGRRNTREARAVLARASQDVALARTALMIARAAEYAVEVEVARAEAEIARLAAKKAQEELDEVGARTATLRELKLGGS